MWQHPWIQVGVLIGNTSRLQVDETLAGSFGSKGNSYQSILYLEGSYK